MRFYTRQHRFYCGVDLHARSMYVCVLDAEGNVLVSKDIAAAPEPFLELIAPYRENLAVAAECMFTWYWLADLCAREGIVFVLGHALYMRAIHGGKAKNDRIDAHKIAALFRGGMLPQAYVYPQEMRATRDLMRRRNYLMRKRAELLGHIQNTNSQYNLPRSARASRNRICGAKRRTTLLSRRYARASRSMCRSSITTTASYPAAGLHRIERAWSRSGGARAAAHHPRHGTGVGAFDPVRDPDDRALCPGAGLCFVLSAGKAGQGIGGQAVGPLGREDRQRASQVGVFGGRGMFPARE